MQGDEIEERFVADVGYFGARRRRRVESQSFTGFIEGGEEFLAWEGQVAGLWGVDEGGVKEGLGVDAAGFIGDDGGA